MRRLLGKIGGVPRDASAISREAAPEPSVTEALLSEQPSDIFMRWARQGRLREALPDLDVLREVSQLPAHRENAFIHTLKVVDAISPTPIRRWAALLHDIGKGPTFIETPEGRSRFFEHDRVGAVMVPEIMRAAGADPALIEPVTRLVRLHMRPISYTPEWTDAAVRRLVEDAEEGRGPEGWADQLALARADLAGYLPEPIERGRWVLDRLEEWCRSLASAAWQPKRQPRSPLDGHEILALAGREPGPWIAQLKSYLKREVEQGRLAQEDGDAASELAREWLNKHP